MLQSTTFRCKKQGFFGMIIPKQYGGKGFSAHGHSQVVQKISTRSSSAAGTVTVPNSLGRISDTCTFITSMLSKLPNIKARVNYLCGMVRKNKKITFYRDWLRGI
jgi:hypothetical protein